MSERFEKSASEESKQSVIPSALSPSIKEILELSAGSIVEFETQAGTPVDIFVNSQFVAKGDVVVVDDYYGVRITEILNPNEIINAI